MSARRLLFTPGPLTTSARVRAAMTRDWGSRAQDFIGLTAAVQTRLRALLGAPDDHAVVLLQGSGTFAVEAMLETFLTPAHRVLVLANGAYGKRIAEILARLGRAHDVLASAEHLPTPVVEVEKRLAQAWAEKRPFTHAVLVHCETTSGVLNPLPEVADLCAAAQVSLLVDAMSSLGCIDIPLTSPAILAVAASANKCLQGVPGIAFVLARSEALNTVRGNARSLVLDLEAQWRGFCANGQWRFTPPVQVLAALDAALSELEEEGGIAARRARYTDNCRRIIAGMASLGVTPLVAAAYQAPIIVTFPISSEIEEKFDAIQDALAAADISIYPGKLTAVASLRIGCIGDLHAADVDRLIAELARIFEDLGLAVG